jgi:hypothetical protein
VAPLQLLDEGPTCSICAAVRAPVFALDTTDVDAGGAEDAGEAGGAAEELVEGLGAGGAAEELGEDAGSEEVDDFAGEEEAAAKVAGGGEDEGTTDEVLGRISGRAPNPVELPAAAADVAAAEPAGTVT